MLERYDREAPCWARGTAARSSKCTPTPCRPPRGARRSARLLDRLHALYPETAGARIVAESVQWRQDCPLFGAGDFFAGRRCRTPVAGPGAGRRRRPHRPARRADGARRDHRLARGQPLLARWGLAGHELYSVPTRGRLAPLRWLAGRRRAHRTSPAAPQGGTQMNTSPRRPGLARRWPQHWPLQPVSRDQWARQQPTYAAAKPAVIDAAVKRAEARPSGNWFVLAASGEVRRDRPFGSTVAGVEVVAWRDARRLVAGPAPARTWARRSRWPPWTVARSCAAGTGCGSARARALAGGRSRPTTTACWRGSGWTRRAARSRSPLR